MNDPFHERSTIRGLSQREGAGCKDVLMLAKTFGRFSSLRHRRVGECVRCPATTQPCAQHLLQRSIIENL